MRMWFVDPSILCKDHLLGEHNEIHKLIGHLRLGKKLGKYWSKGLVDPCRIHERHSVLVAEMKSRGYKHHSPVLYSENGLLGPNLNLDAELNLQDLLTRCEHCRRRMRKRDI